VLHVTQLKKGMSVTENEVITEAKAWIEPDFSLIEHPLRVLDQKERKTRRQTVRMYKIQWSHHTKEEATWETEDYLNTKYLGFLQSRNREFFYPSFRYLIESRDEIPCKGGRLWRPRFLINPNSRSMQLTVVKPWSTWALTSKNSLTYPSEPFWLVDTLVGPTHGQRLGQTTFNPSVHRCLPELLPRCPKFT
jgi:hypothetical protein